MRYFKQNIFINTNASYRRYLKERGIKEVRQYNTPKLQHPTAADAKDINNIDHIWKSGDRFYKLAHEYYGDSTKWWLIALYNQKPTEFHLNPGDIVYIPTPLDAAMYRMGY